MKKFWVIIGVLGFITVIATVIILFVPSLWPPIEYTKSDRLTLLQNVYDLLSLVLTVVAVWFVVHEFSEKQKRADIELYYENAWIFLGIEEKASRIHITNEGQISSSHFVIEFIIDGIYEPGTNQETIATQFVPFSNDTKVLSEDTVVFSSDPFAYNRVANIPESSASDSTGHIGHRILIVCPDSLVCHPDSGIPIGELKFRVTEKESALRRKEAGITAYYQVRGDGIKTIRGKVDYKIEFRVKELEDAWIY